MNKLFNDLCKGLELQGYKDEGGNNKGFRVLSKDNKGIKVFIDKYALETHIVVRYYYKKGE